MIEKLQELIKVYYQLNIFNKKENYLNFFKVIEYFLPLIIIKYKT